MRIFTVKLTVRLSKNIYIYKWEVYYTLTDYSIILYIYIIHMKDVRCVYNAQIGG